LFDVPLWHEVARVKMRDARDAIAPLHKVETQLENIARSCRLREDSPADKNVKTK
jgi:hypothetical protein